MTRLLQRLEEVFWPRGLQCLCCPENSGGELLCPECAKELDTLRLEPGDAVRGEARSVWRYSGCVSRLIIALKLNCLADAAEVLADGMAQAVRDMALPENTILTWVSMPEARLRERGIDHGRVLCEAVAHRCGLPVRQLLRRTKCVHTQRGLTRDQRLANLQDSIGYDRPIDVPVLLIDDVLTTGATAKACSEALRKAGAPSVQVLTAARVIV